MVVLASMTLVKVSQLLLKIFAVENTKELNLKSTNESNYVMKNNF